MPRRKLSYEVEVTTAGAAKAAAALQKEFDKLRINASASTGGTRGTGGGGGTVPQQGFIGGIQKAVSSGPFSNYGIGGFVVNTAMFAAAGALSRVISQMGPFVAGLGELETSMHRIEVSGETMAGSSEQFDTLVSAYGTNMQGFVSEGQAAAQVTQLLALGYADSVKEMTQFTNAQRAAQMATGRTAESIQQNLLLALSNADQSVGRIDQLGISMQDLNVRVEQLRKKNEDLSLGDARRIGIMDILNERFDAMASGGEMAASGIETLNSSIQQLRETAAEGPIGQGINRAANVLSTILGDMTDIQNITPRMMSDAQGKMRFAPDPVMDQILKTIPERNRQLIEEMNVTKEATAALVYHRSVISKVSPELGAQITQFWNDMVDGNQYTAEQTHAMITWLSDVIERELTASVEDFVVSANDAAIALQKMIDQLEQIKNSELGRLDSLGMQAARLGGDPVEIARLIEQGNAATSVSFQYLTAMAENGLISQTEAQLRIAQAVAQMSDPLQTMVSDLQPKTVKAIDRTNDLLREQGDIWKDFISKFEKIPGVFGTSEITEEQKALADMGVPQNFADNVRRRLMDEVLNNKDWADIDPSYLLGRAGLGGFDPKAAVQMFSNMWDTGELWSKFSPAELMDADVIQQELDKIAAAQQGKDNLTKWLGATFGTQDEVRAGLVLGVLDPISFEWNQLLNDLEGSAANSEVGMAFVDNIIEQIQDGRIKAALLDELNLKESEDPLSDTVDTYSNQNSQASLVP
jgi:hypothetical protein